MPAPVNYTSKVAASKTVAEIQEKLAKHGASRIGVEYLDGQPVAMSFMLNTAVGVRAFTLPVDLDRMRRLLIKLGNDRKLGSLSSVTWRSKEHAARVAWRIMKDWVFANLALIDSDMVDLEVVMLPYLKVDENRTLAQAWLASETLALEESR